MANSYFQFKQFIIQQDRCAMKVTTDACLFGAWVADRIKKENLKIDHCLDIGTGTGLLSLMLAQKNPALEIDAIEIDEEAVKQARENIEASPWKNTVFIMPGDAKDIAFALGKNYDVIISNPPFYENELASPDHHKNIAHHSGGLLLGELIQTIAGVLSPNGRFYILLPFKRMTEIELMIQAHHLVVAHTVFIKQSAKHGYFRLFIEGKHEVAGNEKYIKEEIAIKDDSSADKYTAAFINLLKDYYLQL